MAVTVQERLQAAYYRVFFEGQANQEDRSLVLTDLADFTNYFFADDPKRDVGEIHQAQGKRAVMARIVNQGFGEKTNLSALFVAAVTERAKT